MAPQPAIETHRLTKRYGDVTALADCHLSIQPGEVFGLLGPNGAGKTTLIRLLLGFLRPSEGWARIRGWDSQHDALQVHRCVAYLPGDVRLFRRLKPIPFLRLFAALRADPSAATRGIETAERLQLDLGRRIALMSTGMRQKLALAATFATRADVLVLDEPTSSLDPSVRQIIGDMVREVQTEGRTVLFSSHVLPEVEGVCQRVAILQQGRVERIQEIAHLRRQHRIRGRYQGPRVTLPADLAQACTWHDHGDGLITLQTASSLQPLLGWLSTLSWQELEIEPVGLRGVYEEVFGQASTPGPAS